MEERINLASYARVERVSLIKLLTRRKKFCWDLICVFWHDLKVMSIIWSISFLLHIGLLATFIWYCVCIFNPINIKASTFALMISTPVILISFYIRCAIYPFIMTFSFKFYELNDSKKLALLFCILTTLSFGVLAPLLFGYLISIRIKMSELCDNGKKGKYYFDKAEARKQKKKDKINTWVVD